jgi:hypothetical protein
MVHHIFSDPLDRTRSIEIRKFEEVYRPVSTVLFPALGGASRPTTISSAHCVEICESDEGASHAAGVVKTLASYAYQALSEDAPHSL